MRFLAIALSFIPLTVFAANTSFFGPVVPGCTEGGDGICQACNLVQLAENILRVFVSLGVMATALMFAYAGFLYTSASSNKSNIESAKKIFWNALIGLVFIVGAYLIVDIVMRAFTNQSLNVFTRIDCVVMSHGKGGFTYTRTPPVVGEQGSDTGTGGQTPVTGGNPICTGGTDLSGALANVRGTTSYYPGGGGIEGPDKDAYGGVPYTVQDCKNDLAAGRSCKPITVAVPQDMKVNCKLSGGQVVTWDSLADAYGLPKGTQFQLSDSYGCYWKDPSNPGAGSTGYNGSTPCNIGRSKDGNLTFDVAVCSRKHNPTCTVKSSDIRGAPPPKLVPGR